MLELAYVGDSAPRSCTEDEGRPLEVGLQEQASKHLKLLWSKAMVVSVKRKAWQRPCQVEGGPAPLKIKIKPAQMRYFRFKSFRNVMRAS